MTTKEAKATYKAAHLEYLRRRSTMPNSELIGIAKNSPQNFTTTNGITGAIIKYVTYRGGFANRINTTGRKIKNKSRKEVFITGTTKRGTADISVIFPGFPAISIEVKNESTGDRISPYQSKVKAQIEAAGGIYFIATSFEGFMNWWHTDIEKTAPQIAA